MSAAAAAAAPPSTAAAAPAKKRGADMGLAAHEKAPRPPPTFSTGNYSINWLSTAIICIPPLMVLGAILAGVPFQRNTMILMFFSYLLNGFGITFGYHRLFSHRAFTGHWTVQWFFAFAGAGAFQGSIKWWGRNHRIHHRYIDTDKDPYNALRGFFYTHCGWMLMKQDYEILGRVDVSDFTTNKMIMFQHHNYLPIAMLSGILLPTFIAGLGWGDWAGGYFYAGLLKVVIVHHTTFFINSLAHTDFLGAGQFFSDKHSSRDSWFCALLTLGEGYHNFHHEFAQDYRNGIMWYHFDPTKWLVRALEMVGLVYNVVRTPNEVIERNMVSLSHKKHQEALEQMRARMEHLEDKTKIAAAMTWAEVEERVARGEKLTVIGNYVLDLRKVVPTGPGYTHKSSDIVWYNSHPGGRKILDMYVGKDATEAFSGGVYRHSEGAVNILPYLRVARLERPKEE